MSDSKNLGTVLVVGGCGFLGANVVDQLLNFPSEDSHSAAVTANNPTSLEHYTPESLVVHADTIFPSLRARYPSWSKSMQVHALDLRCTHNRYAGCTYHEADITDSAALARVLKTVQPEVIINTASPAWNAPDPILRKVNIEGTKMLLKAAQDAGVRCFVHTSSSSVVHDTQSDLLNANENYPYAYPNPNEYYSETKVVAEKAALEANGEAGMLTCAVRPAGIIGEGDRAGFAYAVTHTGSAAPDWQLNMQLGDGEGLFDVTYVGNVALGLLCAAEALVKTWERRNTDGKTDVLDFERVDGEAFNVTNEAPAYFWDSSRYIWAKYGRNVRGSEQVWALPRELAVFAGYAAEWVNWALGRPTRFTAKAARYACMSRYYSCEKLKRRTGYRPVVGVDEGLERTVKWFKEVVEGSEKKKEN
ncbi:uncharacterized protein HMPREF1541_07996 [Cyphellophora europaea CBS 101466]|uniref:3-beta hydroxysteroid dehydrogenase/isomerase domain-containing protein n=1 Tax=Cyphellophora europaea (strain CBS 101466) TaxID=1220924 RepID=W2RMT3_CYPE1|nr:uncharacterized protein HMPREF1541_07996 [Cyphellophora europaea CBS 101466]ETN37008.1 hypothetical protein HMPREF1541_07996 [Cyphellophora europaea CBS 101466]